MREGLILLRPPHHLCQTEVQHFDCAFRRDLDIGWLQVAVSDSLVVRTFQRLRHLECTVECNIKRQRAAQRFPFHKFQNQKGRLSRLLQSIDRGDIRMI